VQGLSCSRAPYGSLWDANETRELRAESGSGTEQKLQSYLYKELGTGS
jgi:hypothetical protein